MRSRKTLNTDTFHEMMHSMTLKQSSCCKKSWDEKFFLPFSYALGKKFEGRFKVFVAPRKWFETILGLIIFLAKRSIYFHVNFGKMILGYRLFSNMTSYSCMVFKPFLMQELKYANDNNTTFLRSR